MRPVNRLIPAALLLALARPVMASDDAMTTRLRDIAHQWDEINFQMPDARKDLAFSRLETRAESLASDYPGRAEPKVWEAIVLSSHAGARGGIGALPLVRKARDLLLEAEKTDPEVLDGSVYTSLGSLYYQVPGWPIGFGDKKKAASYLKQALAVDPNGIDANYFYGDYLYRQGQNEEALKVLGRALHAKPRPGREVADAGRREEIRTLITKIQAEGSQAG